MLFSLWFYIWYVSFVNGPIATKDEEGICNGEADDKQQDDDAGDNDEDAQNELNQANKPESSQESSKKEPVCKVTSYIHYI